MKNVNFTIDLVVCQPAPSKSVENGPYMIPDTEAKEWIKSDPLGYKKQLQNTEKLWLSNEETDKRMGVISMIRILKYWNHKNRITLNTFEHTTIEKKILKSFQLEKMCYLTVPPNKCNTISKRLAFLFSEIAKKYSKDKDFPVDASTDYAGKEGKGKKNSKIIQDFLNETAENAKKAVELEDKGEFEESLKIWRKIFKIENQIITNVNSNIIKSVNITNNNNNNNLNDTNNNTNIKYSNLSQFSSLKYSKEHKKYKDLIEIVQNKGDLIGIYGIGGSGKTELVLKCAQSLENDFQITFFLNCESEDTFHSSLKQCVEIMTKNNSISVDGKTTREKNNQLYKIFMNRKTL